jgi:putative Ca2+/H+ antiporter (TMEM165/GDT1 family)
MLSILLGTYVIVLSSELLGDRSVYTIASLVSRYRTAPVVAGVLAALAAKTTVAVALGQVLAFLPRWSTNALSVVSLCSLAVLLWRASEASTAPVATEDVFSEAATVSFTGVFLIEWCDPGQIAAATLSVQFGRPGIVWLGAVLALATKALVAFLLGLSLNRYIPTRLLRCGGATLCLLMALSTLV